MQRLWAHFQTTIHLLKEHLKTVNRSTVAFVYDVSASSFSILLALLLRVGLDISKYNSYYIAKHMLVFGIICAGTYWWTRLHRLVWRYVSIRELWAILRSVSAAVVIYRFFWFFLSTHQALPRSTIVISWFLTIAFIGGARFAYRMFHDLQGSRRQSGSERNTRRVLLVGMTDETEQFIRASLGHPATPFEIIGIVDESTRRIGRQIHGVDIRGSVANLPQVLEHLQAYQLVPDFIIVSELKGGGATLRKVFADCEPFQLPVKRLPKVTEWAAEQVSPAVLNTVALEDLLKRPQVSLEQDGVKDLLNGGKVLVTGAGGSIGSELVRQICRFQPQEIILLDHSEYALYQIHKEVAQTFPHLLNKMVLADVADKARVQEIFSHCQPDLVFHAAALKHVPIVEDNPVEGVMTNVLGTKSIAEACVENQVQAMVLISTDKAINPSSVMGATKRLAEKYCQGLDRVQQASAQVTRFMTVRFGNVLGSTGSVVPLFQEQIKKGGPITITHHEMRRYFMTIAEAVELVLQAAMLGVALKDQKGPIFVLDMGEPLYVEEVARHLIRLAGLRPDHDIGIEYVGTRPGEKLFEELFYATEKKQDTPCELIHIAGSNFQGQDLSQALQELEKYARKHQRHQTMHLLQAMVPEYASSNLQKVG